MREYIEKAKVLVEALPYIKQFNGYTVVIKYGGSALVNQDIKLSLIKDIALMKFVGFKPVVVHGGGPEINSMLSRLNIKSEYVDGLRVTDEQTMEVVEMVLTGKLNKEIVSDLVLQGIMSAGISGKDDASILVEKHMPGGVDIGRVGEIKYVNTTLIKTLIDNDFVPVISPVGVDETGVSYNVNADTAALAVAGALKAEKLVFLTDVEGVLRDRHDSGSVYTRLNVSRIPNLIEQGIISGGMIPKVLGCVAAVNAGVKHVHILDGRVEHCLLLEIFTKEGVGTMVEGDL
ncbi:MAG: acetylglutamate kinase [Clostridiales bacterium]|jgi:acetylglutamate kinase|nr:acetylglutamate kinase [Clostridiales bacterium]